MTRTRIVISFTTRPGRGGEGGLGWQFVLAAAGAAENRNERLVAVVDARDWPSIESAVAGGGVPRTLDVRAVSLPDHIDQRAAGSRSRMSYRGWLPRAREEVARIMADEDVAEAHQVTFASFALPSVFPRRPPNSNAVFRWGPATIPTSPVPDRDGRVSLQEIARYRGALLASNFNTRMLRRNHDAKDVVIANNEVTAEWFGMNGLAHPEVEPNIVAEPLAIRSAEQNPNRVVLVGLLVARKQPWVALQALSRPKLRAAELVVVGDGPLRTDLESFVRQERLERRVTFTGRVSHEEASALMATSQVLAHPAAREGSPWVVGEAAAAGVAAVVRDRSGAETTARFSSNGSIVVPRGESASRFVDAFVDGIRILIEAPRPSPTSRWSAGRLQGRFHQWWEQG